LRHAITVDQLSVGVGLVCLFPALLLSPDRIAGWNEIWAAVALQLAVGLGLLMSRRLGRAESHLTGVMSVIAYLLSVALLRDGAGPQAGFGPLVLLPVMWAALRGRRLELGVAVFGVAAVYLLPAMLVGPPRYPTSNWRAGVLFTIIAATLGLLVIRLVERVRTLVGELTELAHTDELTGLPNRRAWHAMLARELRSAQRTGMTLTVVVLDLDGFKGYNDTFGHLAGDALLARLGGKLAAAVFPHGTAYRLGGDEFCALLPARAEGLQATVARAAAALCERGETFTVQASCGAVLVPHEASTADYALQLADERMYARKASRPSAVREQTRDVLVRIMHAKQPGLPDHSTGVAQLAVAVGRRLGMDAEQIDELGRAAELHDIGKVGIPDAILGKPGTLNSEEWEFIRQHTILGERILSAAPALRPVATIVRASHERWDGRGYPDRLRGEQIPLAARIVAVCDAYEAITDNRCYRGARSSEEAREELLREAGGQFDPAVVAAFLEELDAPQPVAPAVPTADEEAAWQLAGEVVERFGLLLGPEVAASETRSVVTTE
jgi:diguanylate cyclase (GGDEF)-like protein